MKHVICFLVFCLVSVFGRVAIGQHGVISNLLANVKPIKTHHFSLIINNNTVIENTSHENNNNITKETSEKDVSDNTIDANQTETRMNEACEPEVKVDNGTALILTPYLKEGKIKEARKAAKVEAKHFLGFKSYSGFLTVNETYNSNLFFWYFPVLDKPVNASPWIIWLQGGPGASSLMGLFDEIGPFTVINDTLERNPYTWLQNHSLMFIDNPVGTGYSFTDHEEGYATNMPTYASHLYTALEQFLQIFPELRTAPLYVAGESYAGKYVPAMAMEIHNHKEKHGSDINLEGVMIGNAYVDPEMISNIAWPYYYFGLLEKEQMETLKPLIDSFHEEIKANRSIKAKAKWNSLIAILFIFTNQKQGYNFLKDKIVVGNYVPFLKTSEIKRAIHVGDIRYGGVNMTVNVKLAPDFLSTTKPILEKLLEHYKVLAYCGHLDLMLPCMYLSENYRTWKWNASQEFFNAPRIPYIYDNKVAGYQKTGGHLTEVVIREAGHLVPMDQPAAARNLVTRWIHDQPLSRRFGILEGSFVQEFVRNNSMIYL